MLGLWDALVGCMALLGIVVVAFGIMLRVIDVSEGLRRLGLVLGSAILLTVLPAVIVGIWSGLSIWQKIGILTLVAAALLVLFAIRRKPTSHTGHRIRH
jgi:Ca2+/Na+ antiporter